MRLLLALPALLAVFTLGECGNVIPILIESVVGSPTLHRKQKWEFDPNEATRLNPDFERQHGHKSEILIQKLGLGIDGHQEERKTQQILRDSIPIENFIPQNLKHS